MKNVIGTTTGALCGVAGIAIGLYFAWRGFASARYTVEQLGEFYGVMGALVGGTCAYIGVVYYVWSKYTGRTSEPLSA